MKKFLKKAEGFTLVELIVVIAILGILTAIAVPTYTGYVEKAKASADTQVLSAANTALAAAMTENGLAASAAKDWVAVTPTGAGDATDGCSITIGAKSGADTTTANAIVADFKTYNNNSDTVTFTYYNTVAAAAINTNGTLAVSE